MASNLCNEIEKILSIDDNAKALGIFVAYTISWRSTEAILSSYPFENDVKELLNYLSSKYTLDSLKSDPVVRAYRDFFWRIGIDPTKTRPASEALVRRGLRGYFPRISPVVDAGNIASAYTMVPIGIYDLAYAKPPFRITVSRGGEVFRPIGGGEEILEKGTPIFVDSRGLVMHIYPHRDSVETMVRETTKEVLIVGAGVPNVEKELVRRAVEMVVKLLEKIGWSWCGVVEIK